MPAGDAHQLPEPVRGRGLGHLPQAEVDSLGEQHVEQTDAVAAGLPGSQVREGLGEPGGVVHLKQDVRDARLGHPAVEVGDHRSAAPSGTAPSVLSTRRTLSSMLPTVVWTGRSRQAAVGISDGGSRQQRLSDVAVAARPRQPDVAGAERVAQVEQHRRLPEAVIGHRRGPLESWPHRGPRGSVWVGMRGHVPLYPPWRETA